mmetsp:Transcript_48167/g.145504  ORF Transcript_48167/g.145504 Transcript_48167/m.145504 type:complete len:102 (-) Transcript_48167:44-349(-)
MSTTLVRCAARRAAAACSSSHHYHLRRRLTAGVASGSSGRCAASSRMYAPRVCDELLLWHSPTRRGFADSASTTVGGEAACVMDACNLNILSRYGGADVLG